MKPRERMLEEKRSGLRIAGRIPALGRGRNQRNHQRHTREIDMHKIEETDYPRGKIEGSQSRNK